MSDTKPAAESSPADPNAVGVTINGRAITARKGELVIAAAQRYDIYIPRFCYHERMNPVGMCRMCLVDIDTGRGPMLQPSCMVTVTPEMKVETESAAAKQAQEGVIELLLANHPLDCPVCDKGGECPLQDQAYSHGPGESRFVEEKRHFAKPIPISDLVLLDRERCILCDRCTRFADEVAGDALIHFTQRGNETQIMTFPDLPFSSYFSGNTVQICPVGALTATPYRFKARPWDLAESETTCTTCSVGCRMAVQSSRDRLVRHVGVDLGLGGAQESRLGGAQESRLGGAQESRRGDDGAQEDTSVNWGWLCDRGRFNFEAVNSIERLTAPLVRGESQGLGGAQGSRLGGAQGSRLAETSWAVALGAVARALRTTTDAGRSNRIAILGGARGTNEDAFAWAQLADAIGIEHRDAQLGDGLPAELLDLPRATIDAAAAAPSVILLGPDLKEELPVLYLRLRDSVVRKRSRLVELAPLDTGLTGLAWRTIRIESGAAAAAATALGDPLVVDQLRSGPVVIVAGRANLAESTESAAATLRAVCEAVAAVQPDVSVLPALRRGNVVGALQLGLRPRPGGLDAAGILTAAAAGEIDILVLLGADPLTDFPDAERARRAFDNSKVVVALDSFLTASAASADVVLPASMFAEKAGTTTNLEGRVTTVAQRVTPAGTSRADWMIAAELADLLGLNDLTMTLRDVESVTEAIATTVPTYTNATRAALTDGGVLAVNVPAAAGTSALSGVAAGERNSYDYRLVLARRLYDRATMTLMSPSLTGLGGDGDAHVNPADADKIGAPEDGTVQLIGARGSVRLALRRDPTVPRGTVFVPFNRGSDIDSIVDATSGATDVRIEVIE
jgi:NADH-quinone oxidoreductase subunit G